MMTRCFIAIELSRAIRKELARLMERLRSQEHLADKGIRWTRPEQIHLTLKFLGQVPDENISAICQAVSSIAALFDPFEFEVGHCECFPPQGPARVLWAGIQEGHEDVQALQEAIDVAMEQLGFAPDARRFQGHLTLARIRQAKVGRLAKTAMNKVDPFTLPAQEVANLTLYQSDLTQQGPRYTPLHHATLGEATIQT